jgi:hypothetical protein
VAVKSRSRNGYRLVIHDDLSGYKRLPKRWQLHTPRSTLLSHRFANNFRASKLYRSLPDCTTKAECEQLFFPGYHPLGPRFPCEMKLAVARGGDQCHTFPQPSMSINSAIRTTCVGLGRAMKLQSDPEAFEDRDADIAMVFLQLAGRVNLGGWR